MKKILILFLCLSIGISLFAEKRCVQSESQINVESFKEFTKIVETVVDNFKLKLKVEKNDIDNMLFKTTEWSFKIRRKTPAIGILPKLKKHKWKKEKIKIIAFVEDGKYCVNFDAVAYNRKDKKWHSVKAPDDFFAKILDSVYLNSIKGKKVWSAGSPIMIVDGMAEKIMNLKYFRINDVFITYSPSKAVSFVLKDEEDGNIATLSIPFIGEIKTVQMAYKNFSLNFVLNFPKEKVPKKYNFFWEYAIHGELMDGMHKNQLLTALGLPYSIDKTELNEEWHYFKNGKEIVFKINNNELVLPDNYKW